jgi:hypothetical protein
MDRLSELRTARGHAQREVERLKQELVRAEKAYDACDLDYRRYAEDMRPSS